MQGVKVFDAASATIFPTFVPPVKKIWSNFSFSKALVSGIPPLITTTDAGSKYLATNVSMTLAVAGANSLGLMTTQFPEAMAPLTGWSDN